MALGLGFSSPPAVRGHGSLLLDRSGSVSAHRRGRRFIVRAINEDEARILSMRDKSSSTLAKRFLAWGRDVHQQASQQMQKFFHDGSLLISFGAPAAARSSAKAQDAAKAQTLPPRPPSRYSKEFSYITKRTKKYTGTELALVVPSSVEKKVPVRVPSTFSKKSPISHRRKRHSEVASDDSVPVLAFKDVQIEGEEVTEAARSKLFRPKTTFARKSPIPDAKKSTTVSGKGKSKLPAVQQVSDTTTTESKAGEPQTPRLSRPATTFIRKSPITFGKGRRKSRSSHVGASEQSSSSAALFLEDNLATTKSKSTNGTLPRPTSVFTRKSPITPGKGGKKRRSSKTSSNDSAVKSEKGSPVSDSRSASEEHKSRLQSRPHATFVRKSPITHARSGRRKRKAAKKTEQESKAADVSVEAISQSSNETVLQTEDTSVVTEVIVETPTDAIKIILGQKESVLVEAVGVADGEPAGVLLEAEKADKVSSELLKDGNDLATLDGNLKAADTDIEFSDDDTASSDETDLSILTIQRLRSIAKSRGLRGYSRLRKAELIELLRKS
ncbi:uncharacterized protein LOC112349324 isoform X2 [Selaginella moellendorffii]|uniref:uncharacterized protein LOC112349324 isoform X2 n=1 Tax=Selaginella moellendorffii TaxID=88036 RepID=UPI000D1C9358|nr:uncharacterized protein LOC112349324 isoform X2 [Selaginella moellendorffii]|eukprot:XP_024539362.1 uncharacterized protein LOC112349324 isoform X2 [Selaginella moellendorffii]